MALEQEKSRRAEAESALALARSEWAEEKRSLEAAVESHEARRAAAWRDASDANTRVEAAQTRAQVAEETSTRNEIRRTSLQTTLLKLRKGVDVVDVALESRVGRRPSGES